jgi:hypothetical protein
MSLFIDLWDRFGDLVGSLLVCISSHFRSMIISSWTVSSASSDFLLSLHCGPTHVHKRKHMWYAFVCLPSCKVDTGGRLRGTKAVVGCERMQELLFSPSALDQTRLGTVK